MVTPTAVVKQSVMVQGSLDCVTNFQDDREVKRVATFDL